MSLNKPLKTEIENDLQNFAQEYSTKQAKQNMFYHIMEELTPLGQEQVVTFAQAQQMVEELATQKQKKQWRWMLPTSAVLSAALVALFLRNAIFAPQTAYNSYSPPLTPADVPSAIAQTVTPYRTVATNNNFYLGYIETDYRVATLDLFVHSRTDNVDWKTLEIRNQNNETVAPLFVDPGTQTVCVPVSDHELSLTVADDSGNQIQCVLPSYI